MKIKVGENELTLHIQNEGELNSEHTNKSLKWIEASFRVFGKDAFEEARNKSQITSISDEGDELTWKVRELSHRYTEGQPHYDFVWELSEIEAFSIETLSLGDFEVHPYLYHEEVENGFLFVSALVKLTPEEFDKLKLIYFGDIYFPVIRQGINSEPKAMRFGKIIWSRDEETIKFKIYLVDKRRDDERDNRLGMLEPGMSNIQRMLASNTERFISLLELLEKKNLLTSDEIEQIKKVDEKDFNSRVLEFERVSDIDKYSL